MPGMSRLLKLIQSNWSIPGLPCDEEGIIFIFVSYVTASLSGSFPEMVSVRCLMIYPSRFHTVCTRTFLPQNNSRKQATETNVHPQSHGIP